MPSPFIFGRTDSGKGGRPKRLLGNEALSSTPLSLKRLKGTRGKKRKKKTPGREEYSDLFAKKKRKGSI